MLMEGHQAQKNKNCSQVEGNRELGLFFSLLKGSPYPAKSVPQQAPLKLTAEILQDVIYC